MLWLSCIAGAKGRFSLLGSIEHETKDNENPRPALITRLEELPEETAQEVGWYLQDTCLTSIYK